MPSYREGFGLAVIEAGAMGIPVIATDIYGLRDASIFLKAAYSLSQVMLRGLSVT